MIDDSFSKESLQIHRIYSMVIKWGYKIKSYDKRIFNNLFTFPNNI
jgi:hypothetical protein